MILLVEGDGGENMTTISPSEIRASENMTPTRNMSAMSGMSSGRDRSDAIDGSFGDSYRISTGDYGDSGKISSTGEENFRLAFLVEEDLQYKELRSTTKTRSEIEFIDNCCKEKTLFCGLTKEQRRAIIKQMYRLEIPKGFEMIRQGDVGNDFYVVYEGNFDIFVNDKKVGTTSIGESVGELALIHNAPRAATVTATEDSRVFAVQRAAFRCAMRNEKRNGRTQLAKALQRIPQFSFLSERSIRSMIDTFEEETFEEGEVITKQGEDGKNFYLVVTGLCRCEIKHPNGKIVDGRIGRDHYFGESALIKGEKYAATITARTRVKTFVLKKKDFMEISGDSPRIASNKSDAYYSQEKTLPVGDLKTLVGNTVGILGKGAFGVVSLVIDPDRKKSFALKAIDKYWVVKHKHQKHVFNERRLMVKLARLKCSFLVNLITTYKDDLRIYFLLEACLGGELFAIMRKGKSFRGFNQKTARFYVACVVEAFCCMHSHNIIYRDLKPENLVLDNVGYLKITDFGFAKEVKDKTYTTCGTPDYVAPEILQGLGHDKAVDWWTLGVLTYEIMNGLPPFYDKEQIHRYDKILNGSVSYPDKFSESAKHFIQSFLMVRPVKRLGMQNNAQQLIERRDFFSGFSYKKLRRRTMKAPIINEVKSYDDMSNFSPVKKFKDHAKPISKKYDFDKEF